MPIRGKGGGACSESLLFVAQQVSKRSNKNCILIRNNTYDQEGPPERHASQMERVTRLTKTGWDCKSGPNVR